MQIKSVIRYVNGSVRIMHDISIFTLVDVLGGNDGMTDIIIGVDDDGLTRYFNISRLLTSQPVSYSSVTSWDKLEELFNTLNGSVLEMIEVKVMVPSTYLTKRDDSLISIVNPFASNSSNQLRIYSGDNDTHINLEYGSVYFPTIRNNQSLRHLLSDVVVNTDYSPNKLNLKNTIPVINGVVCYPEYDSTNNELYARDGVAFVQNRKQFCSNTVLIDVSDLGDMECIKLSDCTNGVVSNVQLEEQSAGIKHGNLLEDSTDGHFTGMKGNSCKVYKNNKIKISFDVPEGKIGEPVLILFGRIVTTLENVVSYNIAGSKLHVECEISRSIVENILISNLEKCGKNVTGTPFYKSYLEKNLERLFMVNDRHDHNEVFEDAEAEYTSRMLDNASSFVVLINTDKKVHLSIREFTYKCNNKTLWFESEANPVGGILINPQTLEIVDYTKVEYINGSLITFVNQTPLYRITNDNLNENIVDVFMSTSKPVGEDTGLFTNIRDNRNLVLVDIQYEAPEKEVIIVPPEEPEVPESSITVKDPMVDLIIPAETRLVIGDRVQINITALDSKTIVISGTEGMDGKYERTNVFSKFNDAVWYCRERGEIKSIYNEDNFWYIGLVGAEPTYRSSDNNGVLMPWNASFIKWFTLEVEEVGSSSAAVGDVDNIQITYLDAENIYVSANYPGLVGKYYMNSATTAFNSRTWSKGDCKVYYDGSRWKVAIGDKVIFETEEAMTSSSPWHHLTWNYLGE